MKNRKSIIAIFVLLAVVFLGIGFAATTEKMNVEGTLNTTAGDFDVIFEGSAVDATNTTSTVSAEITESNNNLKLKVTGLKFVGDKITIKVVVKNTSDEFQAKLSNWTVTKPVDNKYFQITTPEAATVNGQVIDVESTYEFNIVVELLYASIDGSAAGVFEISFDANAVELQPAP